MSASAGFAGSTVHEVTIYDNDLMPPLVFAQPGDTIRFINEDDGQHQIMAEDGSWDTAVMDTNTYVEVKITPGKTLGYALNPDYVEVEETNGEDENDVSEGGTTGETEVTDQTEGEVTFDEVDLSNG